MSFPASVKAETRFLRFSTSLKGENIVPTAASKLPAVEPRTPSS